MLGLRPQRNRTPPRMEVAPETPLKELPYSPSLDVTSMDRSADPCDDLYQFACGGWMKNNPIPPDQSRWDVYSRSPSTISATSGAFWTRPRSPLQAAPRPSRRSATTSRPAWTPTPIERAGIAPLKDDLASIDKLQDRKQLASLLGDLHQHLSSSGLFFSVYSEQDARDATKVIAAVDAGGLGLPDRDYYVKADKKSVETRQRYLAHVQKMFELLGDAPDVAKANAATVMRIETVAGEGVAHPVQRRNPHNVYHRYTMKTLPKAARRSTGRRTSRRSASSPIRGSTSPSPRSSRS